MIDVMRVADNVACLYLGEMAAQVSAKDVNHSSVVELITTGRSGDMGIQSDDSEMGGAA
jgi:D-xylose transport system ATP-binding protein